MNGEKEKQAESDCLAIFAFDSIALLAPHICQSFNDEEKEWQTSGEKRSLLKSDARIQ